MKQTYWLGVILAGFGSVCLGVQTSRVVHRTEGEFKKGKATDTLISSEGELTLSYRSRTLLENEEDVWVVNDLVPDAQGRVYVASSGQGRVYCLDADGHEDLVYQQAETVGHVFSIALDENNRLLLGTGGEEGQLLRQNAQGEFEPLSLPDGIGYIWKIRVDSTGRIFLATGAPGRIITLDPDGTNPAVLYEAKEKNILSLALGRDGTLYAGGDENGLIYRIDIETGEATITYDSGQGEISDLVVDATGVVYAATADQNVARPGAKLILSDGQAGRADVGEAVEESQPEDPGEPGMSSDEGEPEHITPPASQSQSQPVKAAAAPKPPAKPSQANQILRISPEGFVQEIVSQKVMFLSLALLPDGKLLAGLAHDGTLLRVDPTTQEAVVLLEAKPSVQVTALAVGQAGEVYIGCANPGRVLAMEPIYATEGTYESDVIDAGQISRWGRLHIDAVIPQAAGLTLLTRTGNTRDPEQGGWEDYLPTQMSEEDFVIQSRPGRFGQYKLQLTSTGGTETPQIDSVEVSYMMPNLPPILQSVDLTGDKPNGSNGAVEATGKWMVKWTAEDENRDELEYEVWVRPVDGVNWIRLEKKLTKPQYAWDSRTFPEGRYEFKIVASDSPSNPPDEALTARRLSRAIVVDHTPPMVENLEYRLEGQRLLIEAAVEDELSVVDRVVYTVDSAEDWTPVAATDGIFDSRREAVAFGIDMDVSGPHYIAVRVEDALGNGVTRYVQVVVP